MSVFKFQNFAAGDKKLGLKIFNGKQFKRSYFGSTERVRLVTVIVFETF